jgi:uncharacterized protein (TIGR02996 family)
MSDEAALVAAIFDHPDEDTPRLVYADWLDEHADSLSGRAPAEVRARAEFIRCQIELAHLPPGDRRLMALERKCEDLERPYHGTWRADYARAFGGAPAPPVRFRRGFIEHLDGGFDLALRFQDVSAVCPIHEVTFRPVRSTQPIDFGPMAACPALARVRRLDLSYTPPEAHTLLASPHLVGLHVLRVRLALPEVEQLGSAPVAAGLRELWLGSGRSAGFTGFLPGSGIGTRGSAPWPALEMLRLDSHGLGDEAVRALAADFAARGRRALHVCDDHMTFAGLFTAAAAALAGRLESLSLALSTGFGEEALPPGAREFRVEGFYNDGDRIVGWLVGAVPPGRFTHLGLVRCRISRSGAAVLAAWPGLVHIKRLDLAHNSIGDTGAARLAECPHLEHIEQLLVARNDITFRGKDALKARFGRRVRIS